MSLLMILMVAGAFLVTKVAPLVLAVIAIKYLMDRGRRDDGQRATAAESRIQQLTREVETLRQELGEAQERVDYMESRLADSPRRSIGHVTPS